MKRRVCMAIIVMGFSGLIAEIILLRELLIVFSGNELCIGIILANWLILEAAGCFFLGRMVEKSQNKLEAFTVITVLFSLSFFVSVYLTRIMKSVIGISIGESVGFITMLYSSFLILLPVSLLHGALFTFSCRIYSIFAGQEETTAGRVYVYETVGTLVGGVVCTFLLIPYLNAFQVFIGLALLNFSICLALLAPFWKTGRYQKTILVILGGLIFFSGHAVFAGHAEKVHHFSIRKQWKNQNILHYQNSPYGNICIIENQGQYIFFQDGLPNIIIPIPDIVFVEEFVHLPLLVHPEPTKILILSGGAGGVINETLKHSTIEKIDYAELDPLLLDLLRKYPTPLTESELNDERVKVKHTDGRLLLKTTANKYDLIFIGIMEPSNLQANRFFTKEFFTLVKNRLNEGGILVLGAPGSLTFVNQELKNLNSSVFHTLKSVFSHIRVIPGDGTHLFLSSDSQDISTIDLTQIVKRLDERNIAAHVIVPWNLEKKLHPGWHGWFAHFIEGSSQKINYDFKPLGLFYSITHWNALYAPSFGRLFKQFEKISLHHIFLVPVIFVVLYFIIRSRSKKLSPIGVPLAIVTTGFAGMIFSLAVIFTFQSIYGYVFSWIGLLVAFFMAGAACGAMFITMHLERIKNGQKLFIQIEMAIICFSMGLPFLFFAVNVHWGSQSAIFFFKILFLAISFICGLLTGSQFPLANKLCFRNSANLSKTAALLYAADLLGGWFGGIVGAVALLPVLGLVGTCITVGLFKLISLILIITEPIGMYAEVKNESVAV